MLLIFAAAPYTPLLNNFFSIRIFLIKLLLAASIALVALVVIDCKPVDVKVSASQSVPAVHVSSLHREQLREPKEAQIIAPASVMALLPDNTIESTNVQAPVIQRSIDYAPQQPSPLLSYKEIRNLERIRAAASKIGTCQAEANAKCAIVKRTNGIICSNSSAGVDCNLFKGVPCNDEAYDACIDFAQTNGVFCSVGGCAQVLL